MCLGYGEQYKKVLISGGLSAGGVLSDAWLLDPQSERWEEVRLELSCINNWASEESPTLGC